MSTHGESAVHTDGGVTPEAIRTFLRSSVASLIECHPDSVETDVSFGALGLDSMTSVSLLGLVELEYRIEISPDDVPSLGACIDDVVTLVTALLRDGGRRGAAPHDPPHCAQEPRMDPRERRPKRGEHLVINDQADTPSLLDPLTGRIVLTNAVGKRVIELADGQRTVAEIAAVVATRFPRVDAATIGRDVEAFLEDSAAKGLTTWPQS